MKKTLKFLLILAATALLGTLLSLSAFAATYTGSCDENVTFTLDTETGLLEISGTGEMTNYPYPEEVPWHSYGGYVRTVKISNGVTSIGNYAFSYCSSLASVTIVLLVQYLAGWNVEIDEKAADCNGDGKINIKDVVLLAQYLAEWDVTLI